LTDFLEEGQNTKNTTFFRQKHKKVTISKSGGGAHAPPLATLKWRPWSTPGLSQL